jgi:iron-sulfur cluster repair protein YtfE (RIC family)
MTGEEIKNEMIGQHHFLRALLVNIGDLSQKVADGDASCESALREGAHQLSVVLQRHMSDEERLLEELSRQGHGPAAEHLEDFKHNHVHQREILAHFDMRVDSVQALKRLGEIVKAMTHAVLLDMEHEEVSIFGAAESVSPVRMEEAQPQAV